MTCTAQASDRKVWKDSVQDQELINNENNVQLHLPQARPELQQCFD